MTGIRKLMKSVRLGCCLALISILSIGVVGCGGEDKPHEQNQDQQQNDDDVEVILAEVHQLCAAAGESETGSFHLLHCFGPQDPSGKKSESGRLEWQPGAFHVVSE